MFNGGRFRRGCLLPVVIALVVAMICAFGSASTSATAETEATETEKAVFKVTGVGTGVTGTAYKYMTVKKPAGGATEPVEEFDSQVAPVVKRDFQNYIDNSNKPTGEFNQMLTDDRNAFADKLLNAIANSQITLTPHEGNATVSGSDSNAEISFSLSMGGYVIKLSNGSSHVYDPIFVCIWPKDGTLQVKGNFDSSSVSTIGVKSTEIISKKTVNGQEKIHGQINDTGSLTYEVKTQIPRYPANATNKHFAVQDHPDPGLNLNPSSIEVQIGEGGEMLSKGTNYSEDTVDAENERGRGFKIEFNTQQYNLKLADKAGETLVITYKGTLNDKASIEKGTKNHAHPLIAKDNYDPNPTRDTKYTSSPTTSVSTTTVYTYGVKLTKVDSETYTGLPDAQFELCKENGTKVYVKRKDSGNTGEYVAYSGSAGSVTITSNAEGLVQIDGLNAGVTYTLKETKPPAGYDPANSVTIEIKDKNLDGKPDSESMISGRTITPDEHNRLSYRITNTRTKSPEEQFDFTLPKTGAMGTAVFSAFGVALVVAGVALVIVRRRKDKQSS